MQKISRRFAKSYVSARASDPLIGRTIPQQQRIITEKFPDREVYVFHSTKSRANFEDFEVRTNRIAAGFLAAGLKPGECIGIWSPNHEEWIETQFAAAKAGIVLVNVNPSYKSAELAYVLKMCDIRALVSDTFYNRQPYEEILAQTLIDNPQLSAQLKFVSFIGQNFKELAGVRTFSFDNFRSDQDSSHINEVENIIASLESEDPVNIQFTSGTTGSPKGATLSHHNILNNAMQSSSSERLLATEDDVILVNTPFYHCFGCVMANLFMLTRGCKLVIPAPTFNASVGLEAAEAEAATIWYGTPTMYVDLLASPRRSSFVAPQGGIRGLMAGSNCPEQLLKDLDQHYNCKVFVAYGTTENSPITFMTTADSTFKQRTTTVGCVMPHTEAKLVDTENGKTVEMGETGEMCIRGPCVFKGYFNEPEKTAEVVDEDRWYHTGDLATMDESGYVKIVGRAKDMIIRGGENIYPAEVESFLLKHPSVADAQVVGVPSKRLGEEVAAYVRLASGAQLTVDELKEYGFEKMTHWKVPKYIKFVEEYPLTVTGKIRKVELRENAKNDFKLDI